MRQVAETHPNEIVKFHKGLLYLQQLLNGQGDGEKKVALFWGTTGTGKTRMAFDHLDDLYTVFCTKTPWFDGYNNHKNVLLDECGPGMMNHNFLKRILDRYPMQVPIKGGSVWWKPRTIVLTSNCPLRNWYPGIEEQDYKALERRIRIFEFPREERLARAWITNGLVGKRPREESQDTEIEDLRREEEQCEQRGFDDLLELLRN